MILIHKDINSPIKVNEENIHILILENKKFFIEKVNEIIKEINNLDGDFILLDKKGDELSFSKNCDVITDIFSLDFNSKKIKTVILNELKKISQSEEYFIEIKELEMKIRNFLFKIICNSNYDLEIENNFDITKLLKIFDIYISENYDSIAEKFITYIDILSDILKFKLIFCINLLNLFEENDKIEIYKYLINKKINVVFIENNYNSHNINYEKKYIIDNNMCELF